MVEAVAVATSPRAAGELLRSWRVRRRLSQLELASDAEVSTRHLSFVETGRARPSRELLLHLAEHLEVPLRERNRLLLAAGYAPAFEHRPLDADAMGPVRAALDQLLGSHEPWPALVVDQRWDVVAANRPALALLSEGVHPALLGPPVNALRVSLHPDGLAPRIANLDQWSAHLLGRLHRQWALTADPAIAALLEELSGYPGVTAAAAPPDAASLLFVPLRLHAFGRELCFFSTVTTFGTPLDVTLDELSVEAFHPADAATRAAVEAAFGPGEAG